LTGTLGEKKKEEDLCAKKRKLKSHITKDKVMGGAQPPGENGLV